MKARRRKRAKESAAAQRRRKRVVYMGPKGMLAFCELDRETVLRLVGRAG